MVGSDYSCPFGAFRPIFRGEVAVSFREGDVPCGMEVGHGILRI